MVKALLVLIAAWLDPGRSCSKWAAAWFTPRFFLDYRRFLLFFAALAAPSWLWLSPVWADWKSSLLLP
jgi:hypothetical protein